MFFYEIVRTFATAADEINWLVNNLLLLISFPTKKKKKKYKKALECLSPTMTERVSEEEWLGWLVLCSCRFNRRKQKNHVEAESINYVT